MSRGMIPDIQGSLNRHLSRIWWRENLTCRKRTMTSAAFLRLVLTLSVLGCTVDIVAGKSRLTACDLQCHCSKDNTAVNCDNRLLQRIPPLPRSVQRLSFDNNNMDSLKANAFANYPRLQHVSLTSNGLVNIHPKAFKGAKLLQSLTLANNSLQTIDNETWSDLTYLTKLSLANNQLNSLEMIAKTLVPLKNLEELDLCNNNLSSAARLPSDMAGLSELKSLRLCTASIEEITSDYFNALSDVEHLRYVDLENNPLKLIDSDGFRSLGMVKKLDISNTSLSVNSTRAVFDGLQNSSLHILYLQYAFSEDTKLDSTIFDHLASTKLKVLDMKGSFDGLSGVIHHNLFRSLSHLEELYLNDCGLRRVYSRAFHGLKNLQRLDLSNNTISCLHGTCSFLGKAGAELSSVWYLDLSANSMNTEEGKFTISDETFPNLKELSLARNKIYTVSSDMLSSLRKLHTLDLSDNPLSVVEPGAFSELSTLQKLTINKCPRLTHLLDGAFRGLNKLKILSLANNALIGIEPGAFSGLRHLERLEISYNYLGNFVTESLNISLESSHLTTVDLGNNNLKHLPGELFTRSPNIKYLYADYNRLTVVCEKDCVLLRLSGLKVLDLSHNDIVEPNVSCLVDSFGNLTAVNLTGNPFYCSCSSVQWPEALSILVGSQDRSGHMCVAPLRYRGTNLFEFQPSSWECRVKSVVVPLIAVVTTLSVLFILCLCCVIFRRRQSDGEETPQAAGSSNLCGPLQSLTVCRRGRGSGTGLDTMEYVQMGREEHTELSLRGSNGDLHSNPRTNGVRSRGADTVTDTDHLVEGETETTCVSDCNGDL